MKQNKSPQKNSKPHKKKPRKITESYLHNAGLYYLERFASSSGNFRHVLQRKIIKSCHEHMEQDQSQCEEMLDKLIEKFIKLELLNDEQYTRNQVISLKKRGKSERYIFNHLQSKCISIELTKAALEHYATEYDDHSGDINAAQIFARKKRIGHFRGSKEANLQKELGMLARAGFSYEISKKIIE